MARRRRARRARAVRRSDNTTFVAIVIVAIVAVVSLMGLLGGSAPLTGAGIASGAAVLGSLSSDSFLSTLLVLVALGLAMLYVKKHNLL